jgi:hypothetical protein
MIVKLKNLWSKPGLIVIFILVLLIQRWYYMENPIIKTVIDTIETVRTIDNIVNIDKPTIVEKVVNKVVYETETLDPIEIVKIDTQYIEVESIPAVSLIGAEFKDGNVSQTILVGNQVYTFSFDVPVEGTTRVSVIDSAHIQTNIQRFGLFVRFNIGYNAALQHTAGMDLLYINKIWFIQNLRAGFHGAYNTDNNKSNFGIHLGWQPYPVKNNIMITGEFNIWPQEFTLGLQVPLFKR